MISAIIGIVYYWFSNAPKRALEKQIIEMQDMHINLDLENTRYFYNGKDSTYISTPVKKLIVFVDSTSCSGCFISYLHEYYEVYDTLSKDRNEMLVILHPTKAHINEVISRLCNDKFPFWCVVDTIGDFILKNPKLPDNRLLHTFILDNHNNVILVGDPSKNTRIMNLFLKTL